MIFVRDSVSPENLEYIKHAEIEYNKIPTIRIYMNPTAEQEVLDDQGVAESVAQAVRSKSAIFRRDEVSYENPRTPSAARPEYFTIFGRDENSDENNLDISWLNEEETMIRLDSCLVKVPLSHIEIRTFFVDTQSYMREIPPRKVELKELRSPNRKHYVANSKICGGEAVVNSDELRSLSPKGDKFPRTPTASRDEVSYENVKYSGREAEGIRGNSGERSSSEFDILSGNGSILPKESILHHIETAKREYTELYSSSGTFTLMDILIWNISVDAQQIYLMRDFEHGSLFSDIVLAPSLSIFHSEQCVFLFLRECGKSAGLSKAKHTRRVRFHTRNLLRPTDANSLKSYGFASGFPRNTRKAIDR
jgi:hypothetical protein